MMGNPRKDSASATNRRRRISNPQDRKTLIWDSRPTSKEGQFNSRKAATFRPSSAAVLNYVFIVLITREGTPFVPSASPTYLPDPSTGTQTRPTVGINLYEVRSYEIKFPYLL
jgi:hypothetical protein